MLRRVFGSGEADCDRPTPHGAKRAPAVTGASDPASGTHPVILVTAWSGPKGPGPA